MSQPIQNTWKLSLPSKSILHYSNDDGSELFPIKEQRRKVKELVQSAKTAFPDKIRCLSEFRLVSFLYCDRLKGERDYEDFFSNAFSVE